MNHLFRHTVLLVVIAGLSACSSTKKSPPPPRPSETVRQVYLESDDIERVRTGEFVKTYHFGRSTGGRNHSLMHEAHRVYRVEKPNRWNLARNQPPLASTGPVDRIVDSALTPAPRSKAINAELARQQATSARLDDTQEQLETALLQMRAKLGASSETARENAALRQDIARLQSELQAAKAITTNPGPPVPSPPGEALRQWGAGLEAPNEDAPK